MKEYDDLPNLSTSRSSGFHTVGLAEHVLIQAWEDAFETSPDRLALYEVDESWAFLTAQFGVWYRARVDWCVMAGLCPDKLRSKAIAKMGDYTKQRAVVLAATKRKSGYSRKYKTQYDQRQKLAREMRVA